MSGKGILHIFLQHVCYMLLLNNVAQDFNLRLFFFAIFFVLLKRIDKITITLYNKYKENRNTRK